MRYFIISLILIFSSTNPQIGCLTKSKQLREQFDHKEYAPVACTCPCDQYQARGLHSPEKNQCLECLHSHDPKPLVSLMQKIAVSPRNILCAHPLATMRAFVTRHRHKTPVAFDTNEPRLYDRK